jgi:hypothetical protein
MMHAKVNLSNQAFNGSDQRYFLSAFRRVGAVAHEIRPITEKLSRCNFLLRADELTAGRRKSTVQSALPVVQTRDALLCMYINTSGIGELIHEIHQDGHCIERHHWRRRLVGSQFRRE